MYKNKVFDITRSSDYNVGVEKCSPLSSAPTFFYGDSRFIECTSYCIRRPEMTLLDEIHSKQQLLDQLDYMIHEIKKIDRRILL